MSAPQRSARLPWFRSGLLGLATTMLPFAWVLDASSCGGVRSNEVELTGLEVVSKFGEEALFVGPVLFVLFACTPFIAKQLKRPVLRVLVQLVGLVAVVFCAWFAGFAMFFTIFGERDLRPAGGVVLALFGGCVVDAVLRLGFALQELRSVRAASRTESS